MNIKTNSLAKQSAAQNSKRKKIENFGGNQKWEADFFQPTGEKEVLDILHTYKDSTVRPVGSLHSWSAITVSDGATVAMSGFDEITPYEMDGQKYVRLGAGVPLQRALDQLHATTDQTFPTLGAIKKQTISGAISTATHGSGKPSISHFVEKIRLAAYDPETGQPKIFEYSDGDKLRAARCGLGTQGVILSVDLKTVPKYLVEETVVAHPDLDSVLEAYEEKPLTQFTLMPYRWDYMSFERKPIENREMSLLEKTKAKVMKAFNTVGVDFLWHALMKGSVWLGDGAVKNFLKLTPHMIPKGQTVVNNSEDILTMHHDLFQHEEMELFLPESKMKESVDILKYATEVFSGESPEPNKQVEKKLKEMGMFEELMENKGRYTQHYPIFFRKILPEDAMVSMSSGDKAHFSCSIFTYNAPDDREAYGDFCSFLARALNKSSGARLHWGKHFPLGKEEMERAYPELDRFRELATETDPNGVFRNVYTERVLGLAPRNKN